MCGQISAILSSRPSSTDNCISLNDLRLCGNLGHTNNTTALICTELVLRAGDERVSKTEVLRQRWRHAQSVGHRKLSRAGEEGASQADVRNERASPPPSLKTPDPSLSGPPGLPSSSAPNQILAKKRTDLHCFVSLLIPEPQGRAERKRAVP